jgi:superfamily II DNA or RNA helicase
MPQPDRFIASCKSWGDFYERTKELSAGGEKGAVFERLTQLYLQTAPEYRTTLQHVWLLREVPPDIRKQLNLPGPDEGIDLLARTRRGEYWAIQSKFRSQRDIPLNRRELGTFTSLAFNTCNDIALAVVAHTSTKPVSKHHLMRKTVEIGLDRWQSLDHETWGLIVGALRGQSVRLEARSPKPHQCAAISAAKKHFIDDGAARGRLIMPCGTGKSLTAYWIAEALTAKTILVAVPSLALVRQSLADWTREFLTHNVVPDWLCVCSDESVGNLERDEFVGEVYDLGLPTHTDVNEIAALLRARSNGPKIVFTTYQSSDRLAAAARKAGIKFDLAILDEAHKTVGVPSKKFATLLRDKKITIRRRIFMTATERVFRGDRNDVLSMDSEKDYGKRFFQLSFKEAIKQGIITDYKILTMTVSDGHIRRLIDENRILNLNSRDLDEAEAQSVAAGIALKRIYKDHAVKHAISFHRSILAADRFREQQDALNRLRDIGPKTINLHISSKKTAGQRSDLMREFTGYSRALMTNARCLTEGVDVPAIDCVMFADPKQSRIDIVQAAGRALRRYEGKEHGYIVVPLVVPEKMDFEKFAETTAFKQVAQTITALSTQDERIADEFRAIEQGRISSGKIVEIEGDIPVGMKIKLGDFAEAISTRIWESVGHANWRNFEDARAFVRDLGLKSGEEWTEYCSSSKKPPDIPASPDSVYLNKGWLSMGDWLGTGSVAHRLRQYRSFNKARAFVNGLGLKSADEWRNYCKSVKKPADIPANPHNTYAEAGWTGWGDWLGTGFVSLGLRQYRSFRKARAFVRSLGLKSQTEWSDYRKSAQKPADIPSNPHSIYLKTGWAGYGDWLGTGSIATHLRQYRSFKKARAFVNGLNLKSRTEWSEYCSSGKKPADIPADPNSVYADAGWAGMGDWLGTGAVAAHLRQYRHFKKARAFVRGLGFKSQAEWYVYSRSGKKPADIPAYPSQTYANSGWAGMGDWLGTGRRYGNGSWRPFGKARTFVRGLGFKSQAEWRNYCKSGKKPADIPVNPDQTYANDGWSSWGDWLGTGTVAPRLRQYRSFNEARTFVRGLGLKSSTEWFDYRKSEKKPDDIPSNPNVTYADTGWSGMGDWLGTGRRHGGWRPFGNARTFVRGLGLKSEYEWRNYCKSGKKPADIPGDPYRTYAKTGWAGLGDWLGTGTVATRSRQYRRFKKARTFVRGLGLKSTDEWSGYCKSVKKPADIPASPSQTYANSGWVGMGDWLGTGRRYGNGSWRPFKKARSFVRSLGLKSRTEWDAYKSKKPADIPTNPYRVYAKDGWSSWGDWLGYATQHSGTRAQADGVGITR